MPGLYFNKGNEKRMSITYTGGGERCRERENCLIYTTNICKRDDGTCTNMSSITLEIYIYFIIIFDAVHLLLRKKVVLKSREYIICPCI